MKKHLLNNDFSHLHVHVFTESALLLCIYYC